MSFVVRNIWRQELGFPANVSSRPSGNCCDLSSAPISTSDRSNLAVMWATVFQPIKVDIYLAVSAFLELDGSESPKYSTRFFLI